MNIDYSDVSTWSDEMVVAAICALMDSGIQKQLSTLDVNVNKTAEED